MNKLMLPPPMHLYETKQWWCMSVTQLRHKIQWCVLGGLKIQHLLHHPQVTTSSDVALTASCCVTVPESTTIKRRSMIQDAVPKRAARGPSGHGYRASSIFRRHPSRTTPTNQ